MGKDDGKVITLSQEQYDRVCEFMGKMVSLEEINLKQQQKLDALQAQVGQLPKLRGGLPLPGSGWDAEDNGKEKRYLFQQWIRVIANKGRMFPDTPEYVKKALAEGSDSTGGTLVPIDFLPVLIRIIEERAMMRSRVRVINMPGDTLEIGTLTSGATAYWPAENQEITQGDPATNKVTLTAKKLAVLVFCSSELLEDSRIDISDLLTALFAEAFADEEDRVILRGSTVAGDPFNGVLFTSSVNQVTMGSGKVDFSDVDFVEFSALLDSISTKASRGALLFFHRNIRHYLRLLHDSNHQPLWQPTAAGSPETIYGYNYVESDQMPASGDSAISTNFVAYGNPQYIWFGDRREMRLAISEHIMFKNDQVGFRATERFGLAAPSPAASFGRLRTAAA